MRYIIIGLLLAAGLLPAGELQSDLAGLNQGFRGRVGVCIQHSATQEPVCNRGTERFSLQSVMKLIVGAAVMGEVDAGRERLDNTIVVKKENLSVYAQPVAQLIGKNGYRTTVGDLIRRAIVDSDSAAVDILLERMGGPAKVKAFLDSKGLRDLRVDRDERHLQCQILGMDWRPEFVDVKVFEKAIAAIPDERKTAAYKKYQAGIEDTATPLGMNAFLRQLVEGKMLSPQATDYLIRVMKMTVTGPDRLKAGVPAGWTLAHKTGTSGSWKGVTAAINDVGILFGPQGERVTVTVFVGDTEEPAAKSAAVIAKVPPLATRK